MEWPADIIKNCLRGDDLLLYLRSQCRLHTGDRHRRFTASLPLITNGAQNRVSEQNTASLLCCGGGQTATYVVSRGITDGYSPRVFSRRIIIGCAGDSPRGFSSIIIRGDIQAVTVRHSGQRFLEIRHPLVETWKDEHDSVELMSFLKHLPFITGGYDVILETNRGVTLTTLSNRLEAYTSAVIKWKVEQFETEVLQVDGLQCEVYSTFSFISEGLLICCENGDGSLVTDVIRSLWLSVGFSRTVAAWRGSIHGVDIKKANHYRVDIEGKVNMARVDMLRLVIKFHDHFQGRVYIFNHHQNLIVTAEGYVGMAFSR